MLPRARAACECCPETLPAVSRRTFLAAAGLATAGSTLASSNLIAAPSPAEKSETLVAELYKTLQPEQRKAVCFDWEYTDKRGQLRTHISNNWRITPPAIEGTFFTKDQQRLIRSIWEGLVNPDWIERFDRQFKDDLGGFGKGQSIALFGEPGAGKFEFVLSGRHGTVRCDGNSADHVAFGGPILYGHAASGYFEKSNHPNNVFWHQAEAANKLFQMLSAKERERALLPEAPDEALIAFQGKDGLKTGLPVADLSDDQKRHAQEVLQKLIEPFRQCDRDEAVAALAAQGGLDACRLTFYKADDLGDDGVWDNWRLEGPAFVWHYRGAPHVHVWVNVANDPAAQTNSKNLSGPLREKK